MLAFSLTLGSVAIVHANSQTPSSWAVDYVIWGIMFEIVPENLQSNYTQPITRAEFSALAVALYEFWFWDGEIAGRINFVDTNDINVQKAAYIGVVTGVGDNRFAPHENLTREQAAVMISRLAVALEYPLTQQTSDFADNSNISNWAIDAVGQMQSSQIMGGVGNNLFSPQGSYTREQSIVTIMRLLNIALDSLLTE